MDLSKKIPMLQSLNSLFIIDNHIVGTFSDGCTADSRIISFISGYVFHFLFKVDSELQNAI